MKKSSNLKKDNFVNLLSYCGTKQEMEHRLLFMTGMREYLEVFYGANDKNICSKWYSSFGKTVKYGYKEDIGYYAIDKDEDGDLCLVKGMPQKNYSCALLNSVINTFSVDPNEENINTIRKQIESLRATKLSKNKDGNLDILLNPFSC